MASPQVFLSSWGWAQASAAWEAFGRVAVDDGLLDGDAFDLSLVEAVPRDGTERHGCDRGTCGDASPPAPPHRGWVGVGNQRRLVGTEAAGVDRVGDGAPRVPKVSDDGFVARAFEHVGARLGHRRCLRRWSRARW